jgi:predicted enzyme related to lactoylglutathione lyase
MTRDYDKNLQFYRDVLGWTTEVLNDTPEFRYTNLGAGADATAARALELGGQVSNPPHDTPFGRLATIVDATGATFNVMQTNQVRLP